MPTPDSVPLDKSGCPILVGNYIVYGHALGRCAGLRFGKVLAITPKPKPLYRDFSAMDSRWTITVIGYDDDASYSGGIPKVCKKTGSLGFPERILVIQPEFLTEEIRKRLDSFTLKKKHRV